MKFTVKQQQKLLNLQEEHVAEEVVVVLKKLQLKISRQLKKQLLLPKPKKHRLLNQKKKKEQLQSNEFSFIISKARSFFRSCFFFEKNLMKAKTSDLLFKTL